MKRLSKPVRILVWVLAVLLVLLLVVAALFANELLTLASLEKLDDYGMFRMTYRGDYGFDEFLKVGAQDDGDIERFVAKRLLKGLPVEFGVTDAGCTAFVAKNKAGETVYSRNFDFDYAPSLQLFTAPSDGYASVSTVNLAFAGYSQDNLPEGSLLNKFLTLAAPFLPFDGMNEKGVAIALLAVPKAEPKNDPERVTLNTTTAIRLVLDRAANVDEAVELLKGYNIYFSGDVDCHFLIADASGRSVLVEYYDNDLRVTQPDADYQIASNFIAYNGLNIGEGGSEFERYDTVKSVLESSGGKLDEKDAAALLAKVGIMNGDADVLQWSVVYNLSSLDGSIFAHRRLDSAFDFSLPQG